MKISSLCRAAWISAVAIAASMAGSATAQLIRIKGSDTLGAKLVPLLADGYRAKNPGVEIEIAAEGSATAFQALIDGTADIGMSSRKPKAVELAAAQAKGVTLSETVACQDMLVVVVNQSNKVKGLTKEQVMKIFTGAVKDWSEVGGSPGEIAIYTPNSASGTYKDWQRMAMEGKDYAKQARKIPASGQVGEEVARDVNGIGYVGPAYAKKPGIHSLAIDGVEPAMAKVKEYAYMRACYYYQREGGYQAAKDFVAYATGAEGRKIVEELGFAPAEK